MPDIKQRIEKILNESQLNISSTRRSGANGLRNADEIADRIVEELTEREDRLREALGANKKFTEMMKKKCAAIFWKPVRDEVDKKEAKFLSNLIETPEYQALSSHKEGDAGD